MGIMWTSSVDPANIQDGWVDYGMSPTVVTRSSSSPTEAPARSPSVRLSVSLATVSSKLDEDSEVEMGRLLVF